MRYIIPMFAVILVVVVISLVFPIRLPPPTIVTERNTEQGSSVLFDYSIVRYPTRVELTVPDINPAIGMNIEYWQLDFGVMPTGSGGKKSITIDNPEGFTKIKMSSHGDLARFLTFSQDSLFLNGKENTTIDVTFSDDGSLSVGNHTGEVDVMIIKPKFEWAQILMWLV